MANKEKSQQILGWTPNEMDDLRFLVSLYAQQGAYDFALTLLEGLEILSPNNLFDLQMFGAIYLEQGEALKALDAIDRALQLDHKSEPTLLNRAMALFSLGYRKQGLQQALELQSSSDPTIASQAIALVLAYQA